MNCFWDCVPLHLHFREMAVVSKEKQKLQRELKKTSPPHQNIEPWLGLTTKENLLPESDQKKNHPQCHRKGLGPIVTSSVLYEWYDLYLKLYGKVDFIYLDNLFLVSCYLVEALPEGKSTNFFWSEFTTCIHFQNGS